MSKFCASCGVKYDNQVVACELCYRQGLGGLKFISADTLTKPENDQISEDRSTQTQSEEEFDQAQKLVLPINHEKRSQNEKRLKSLIRIALVVEGILSIYSLLTLDISRFLTSSISVLIGTAFVYSFFWTRCAACKNIILRKESRHGETFLGSEEGIHVENRESHTSSRFTDRQGHLTGYGDSTSYVPVTVRHVRDYYLLHFVCPVCSHAWDKRVFRQFNV